MRGLSSLFVPSLSPATQPARVSIENSWNSSPADRTRKLEEENEVHGDLLLGRDVNVEDSYHTLVQKSVGFFVYAYENVRFQYLAILDDDVYFR